MSLESNTIHRFTVLILPLCPNVSLCVCVFLFCFVFFFNFALNVSYGALQYRDRVMSSVWRTEAFVTKAGTNNEDI